MRLLLVLEEFLGLLGILVHLLSDPGKKSNLGQKLKSFDSIIDRLQTTRKKVWSKKLTVHLSTNLFVTALHLFILCVFFK